MHMDKLLEKIARLEFINDQVVAELQNTDKLLRAIGFAEGLKGVKNAAREILEQEQHKEHKVKKHKKEEDLIE